jgi:hypothetical protein
MSQVRIYLPLNAAGLRQLAESRELGSTPLRAFGVTERLERALPTGDDEEWEYAALCHAVEAAGALREGLADKRVVAAADVDDTWVGPRSGDGSEVLSAVEVESAVPLARIVSFHIDEAPGAQGTDDLLWYDATELDEVLRLV